MEPIVTKLDVVFLGARRCGKSSTLASMIDSLDHSHPSIRVISADERTEIKMREKGYELRSIFRNIASKPLWFDDEEGSDKDINEYRYNVTIGKNLKIELHCIDIPGETIDGNMTVAAELVKNADVVIIAIDTPQLQENGYKGVVFNRAKNVSDLIEASLAGQNCSKQLLFVPMKCEKYVHNKSMSKIVSRIKEVYANLIRYWKSVCDVPAYVVPVQTLGDLEFSHFATKGGVQVAYYKYVGNKNYSPRWCEQPMIYAINFQINRISWPNAEEIVSKWEQARYNFLDKIL